MFEKLNEKERKTILEILDGKSDLMLDHPTLYDKLYNHYINSGEMPYGTAKGRDGDPDYWILDQLEYEMKDLTEVFK
jgi:hypothetical protein